MILARREGAWARRFDEPVPLPDGGRLRTLHDARAYILGLPEAMQQEARWQAAVEALLVVVQHRGPTMFARIGMMRAIERGRPAPVEPRRKRAKVWRILR